VRNGSLFLQPATRTLAVRGKDREIAYPHSFGSGSKYRLQTTVCNYRYQEESGIHTHWPSTQQTAVSVSLLVIGDRVFCTVPILPVFQPAFTLLEGIRCVKERNSKIAVLANVVRSSHCPRSSSLASAS